MECHKCSKVLTANDGLFKNNTETGWICILQLADSVTSSPTNKIVQYKIYNTTNSNNFMDLHDNNQTPYYALNFHEYIF